MGCSSCCGVQPRSFSRDLYSALAPEEGPCPHPSAGWPPWLVDVGTKVCHLAWIWSNAEGLSSCRTAGGWTRPLAQLHCSRALHPVLAPFFAPCDGAEACPGGRVQKTKDPAEACWAHRKYWTDSNFIAWSYGIVKQHSIVHNFKEKWRRQNRKLIKIHIHTHRVQSIPVTFN